jgi:hypothetical protein
MRVVAWMAGLSLLSWLVVAALPGMESDREVLFGLLGPLAAVSATWILVDRTHRSHPERLPALLIAGLAGKMIFFGGYVTVMLTALALQPVPFAVSFTAYFLALYAVQAVCLQRLSAR